LPARIVTNAELAEKVDTSDEWIVERTGIRSRHIADDSETTSSLATDAARAAMAAAGVTGADIDLIVLATATPDQTFRPRLPLFRIPLVRAEVLPSMWRRCARALSMPWAWPIRCCVRAWPNGRW
jgi:3-oxoacyl-[acyl-carrier-protein] synthase III